MKLFIPVAAIILSATFAHAQTTDSLDNIVLQIPKNWQVNKQSSIIDLSTFSKDRFCQMAIYQKQAASKFKEASFEREWSNLVLASFDAATKASPLPKKTRNGYNVLYFGSQGKSRNDDKPYYVELYMFDCGNTVQSAMLIAANKEHLQFFDSAWQSLIVKVKNSGSDTVVALPGGTITGKWGITIGAYKYFYEFKSNGNYTLHGEGDAMMIDETGSYTILDKQLVIMPAQSKLKRSQKTESLDRSRRTYSWQIIETNLVLSSPKNYLQDGGDSNNMVLNPVAN